MAIDITEIKNKILTFNEELIEFQENINNYKTEQYGAGSFGERRNSINLLDQVKELSIATSYILDGGVSGGLSEWTHTGSIDEYFNFSGIEFDPTNNKILIATNGPTDRCNIKTYDYSEIESLLV